MTRTKQTARKSTTHSSLPPVALDNSRRIVPDPNVSLEVPPIRRARSQVMNDTCRVKMEKLLQTKRKSATPQAQRNIPAGPSGGKQISGYQVKTKPRNAPGETALKEIQKIQAGWQNLIPRAAFHRLVREITLGITSGTPNEDTSFRYQTSALEALQDATESFLVQLFEDSNLCCIHAKRVTLFKVDMDLCLRLQRARLTRM